LDGEPHAQVYLNRWRDPYYKAVYQFIETAVANTTNRFSGSMFWAWAPPTASPSTDKDGVYVTDTTFQNVILPHVRFMNKMSGVRQICGPGKMTG
jgi:hypothetical protein